MNSRIFLIILLAATALPFALSFSSYDELVSSYNYSYATISDSRLNASIADCTAPCKNLTFALTGAFEPGNYEFYGYFDGKSAEATQYFFEEENTVKLVFFPPFYSNNSALWLKILKDGKIIRYENAGDFDISGFAFQNPSFTVLSDYEEGGKIVLDALAQMQENGKYQISAYLQNRENNEVSVFKSEELFEGQKNVSLYFDPGVDGNFTLTKVEIGKFLFHPDYKTHDYSLAKIRFFSDEIINGDLVVLFDSNKSDSDSIELYLFDSFSQFVTGGKTENSRAIFPGDKINASGLNGPYIVKAAVGRNNYEYITSYYDYTQFEKQQKIVSGSAGKGSSDNGIFDFIISFFSADNKKEAKENQSTKKDVPGKSDGEMAIGDIPEDEPKNDFVSNLLTGNAISGENIKEGVGPKTGVLVVVIAVIAGALSIFLYRKFR